MASDSEPIYCICRLPYDETQFMIECEVCKDWFHGSCVGVQEHQAPDIEIFHCPNCQPTHGPLVLKSRKNNHRHDYADEDSEKKAIQTGTVAFIKELKKRTFASADDIPIVKTQGYRINRNYFEENGFSVPLLVDKIDGLGLTVPPSSFSIEDIENYVGSMREIDVIDVSRQEDCKMLMREWTDYYLSPNRTKIYNVISLEFSNTKLAEIVKPPSIVSEMSWVQNIWPQQLPEDVTFARPEVQKYCLMGVRDSFTDFHIDFGGTSVWYHVLRGEKVFYLIQPTATNLSLYENWLSSSNQSETFFGDQVDKCYKCRVKAGQTLFIPTGWIHAVFTPIDSLVFGGNFLHSLNIPLQLQAYEIERRVKTPEKYLFPSYEIINWYAAKHCLEILKDCSEDKVKPQDYVVAGAKALSQHLRSWTQRKDFVKTSKHEVPEYIQYGKLLKELNKEVKAVEATKASQKKSERKRKKKDTVSSKKMINLDILHQHTTEKLKEVQQDYDKTIYNFKDEDDEESNATLKVRIPKAGAYLDSTIKQDKAGVKKQNKADSALRLKVSNGKIVSDKKSKASSGKFQRLSEETENKEVDSDEDNLVVDENPRKKQKTTAAHNSASATKPSSTAKYGSLKLKLSFAGKTVPSESTTSQESSSQDSDAITTQSEAESVEDSSQRLNIPTIRGGLNGSIADILEASGYGTETDFKVDPDTSGSATSSTREAIQGMLSMSQMNSINLFSSNSKSQQSKGSVDSDEEEKLMADCFRDDEYVYPSLVASDDEESYTYSTKKNKRDETWNPKARVNVTVANPVRPVRTGVKKEAIECGLAAVAKKLAESPAESKPPKIFKPKKSKPIERRPIEYEPQPGTSESGSAFRPDIRKSISNPPESPPKPKKPKKGSATAKQRLGKILKIHKMVY